MHAEVRRGIVCAMAVLMRNSEEALSEVLDRFKVAAGKNRKDAAVKAIDRQPDPFLDTTVAAVYLKVSPRHAQRLLRRFQKESKLGVDWKRAGAAPTGKGHVAAGNRGVRLLYHRDRLREWRMMEKQRRGRVRHEHQRIAEHEREVRAEIDGLVRAQIELLRERGKPVRTKRVLELTLRACPWLVRNDGVILDSLSLPRRSSAQLAEAWANAHVEYLTIAEVVCDRDWADRPSLESWHRLFGAILRLAQVEAMRREADIDHRRFAKEAVLRVRTTA